MGTRLKLEGWKDRQIYTPIDEGHFYSPPPPTLGDKEADAVNHILVLVVVALLFYIHGKHLRSCRDGQLT